MFMPSLGFCFIAMILLWRLGKKWNSTSKIANFQQLRIPASVLALVFMLFSVKSFTRNFIWKDNFTLFTTDIYTSPNSAKIRNSAAGALLEKSKIEVNTAKQEEMFREAKGHALEAIRIHPTYKNAYLLLGNANNYLKLFDESISAYQTALQLDGNYTEANNNLAITYREAGRYYGEKLNNAPKSIQYLEKAQQMTPNDMEVLRLLGIAYGVSGQTSKAIEMLEKAVSLDPNNASILYNLGAAYGQLNNEAKAQEYINRAKALDPNLGN